MINLGNVLATNLGIVADRLPYNSNTTSIFFPPCAHNLGVGDYFYHDRFTSESLQQKWKLQELCGTEECFQFVPGDLNQTPLIITIDTPANCTFFEDGYCQILNVGPVFNPFENSQWRTPRPNSRSYRCRALKYPNVESELEKSGQKKSEQKMSGQEKSELQKLDQEKSEREKLNQEKSEL